MDTRNLAGRNPSPAAARPVRVLERPPPPLYRRAYVAKLGDFGSAQRQKAGTIWAGRRPVIVCH